MNGELIPQPMALEEVALISGHPTMSGRNRLLEEKNLSIKPGNPTPELPAEFWVGEEEASRPRDSASTLSNPALQSSHSGCTYPYA
jgi:hypothetical protein